MTGILIKRGFLDAEADTHTGRMPRETEDRDSSNASTGQGMPTIASALPDVREAKNRFSLTALRRSLA